MNESKSPRCMASSASPYCLVALRVIMRSPRCSFAIPSSGFNGPLVMVPPSPNTPPLWNVGIGAAAISANCTAPAMAVATPCGVSTPALITDAVRFIAANAIARRFSCCACLIRNCRRFSSVSASNLITASLYCCCEICLAFNAAFSFSSSVRFTVSMRCNSV